jgi:transposase InsO family protein
MKKNYKYSLQTRIAFALGIERDLVLPSELKRIPYSTRSWLRRQSVDELIDANPESSRQILSEIRAGMTRLSDQLTDTYSVTFRLLRALRRTIGNRAYQNLMFELRNDLIPAVDVLQPYSTKEQILRFFGVTRYRYAEWENSYHFTCSASPMNLCARRHTAQLLPKEVAQLKKLLKDPETAHWSIASVWAKGLRDGKLKFGRSTAYEHNRKYRFRARSIKRKPKYKEGIRAGDINEIWHADTSMIRSVDGFVMWVYAIIDNHSRKILAMRVDTERKGFVMRDVLRDAILTYHPKKCVWITDSGTENINGDVYQMLKRYHEKVDHTVAKRDIRQSNSMIERVFYTLKYTQRMRGVEITSLQDAVNFMEWFVEDYNNRPHTVHKIFSPNEVYAGTDTYNYQSVLKTGMSNRRMVNSQCACTKCICGDATS